MNRNGPTAIAILYEFLCELIVIPDGFHRDNRYATTVLNVVHEEARAFAETKAHPECDERQPEWPCALFEKRRFAVQRRTRKYMVELFNIERQDTLAELCPLLAEQLHRNISIDNTFCLGPSHEFVIGSEEVVDRFDVSIFE